MSESNHLFDHGGCWLRADFHLHTRSDREFKYDGADDEFLNRYVAKLQEASIRIGIITNHNKFDINEFKALRRKARKEGIYLLPGVELSVKDGQNGIHTLVVFHDDWINEEDQINNFLNSTYAGQSNRENDNARSNHDLHGTIQLLDNFKRDYFLIFAHVEANNGIWNELGGGRITELGNDPHFKARTAAFQKVRTYNKPEDKGVCRAKVQQWLGDWYPAEVEGSDPKSIDEIGKGKSTFIKIGAFTFEAVLFALKSYTERVSQNKIPQVSHSYIRSIHFEGGNFDGKQLHFSPQLNCLIGIRGSGKSAVLEALRYALGQDLDDSIADSKYKRELLSHFALDSGGKVVVETTDKLGRKCEVRRILNESADVYCEDELRHGITPQAVLHNPRFFGQKELVPQSDVFGRDLLEKLTGEQLLETRREINKQKQKVRDTLRDIDKLQDLDALEEEHRIKQKEAELRLEFFQTHGVEEQLRKQVNFNADVSNVRRLVDVAGKFVHALETFLHEQAAELGAHEGIVSKDNQELVGEFNAIFTQLQSIPQRGLELLTQARQCLRELRTKSAELEAKRDALKDEFAAIERQLSTQLQEQGELSIRPDDFVKWSTKLQKANLALREIVKSKTRRDEIQTGLTRELKKLSDLWHREFQETKAAIDKLTANQTALSIRLEYKGDKAAFQEQLKASMRGSRLREDTLRNIINEYSDFGAIYENLEAITASVGDVFRQYFGADKETLLTWQVPNKVTFYYHGKPLEEHSLGQKASALMLFILNQQDSDLIVIDQPEDDLDNQTIFEDVIKLVQKLKVNTQFIFATHNANFPVLGDAEQVGVLSYSNGHADLRTGSIDNPEIQDDIVSIMEGGKVAFEQRKEIYQLWKH